MTAVSDSAVRRGRDGTWTAEVIAGRVSQEVGGVDSPPIVWKWFERRPGRHGRLLIDPIGQRDARSEEMGPRDSAA